MLVKICGLMRREDVEAALQAGADLLGFIFVRGSRRWVDPAELRWIREIRDAETVGVFQNASPTFVLEVSRRLRLDRIQLHGEEPDEVLEMMNRPVIRRVGASAPGLNLSRVEALLKQGVLPLVDPGAGDGVIADWREIGRRLHGVNFALAGGLSPDNVSEAICLARPVLVDVSSGVETVFGQKDRELMEAFVRNARLQT